MIRRRAVLEAALGSFALPLLPRLAQAAGGLGIAAIADELALVTGAGGNVLVLSADAGQVVVDSGAAEFAAALLATLAELPGGGRVQKLFNTHWHSDQVGGNEPLGRAGAVIVAHEKTRQRLSTDYFLPTEDRYQRALPVAARPTETFYTRAATAVGDHRIEYGYLLEAHTDGDIYVKFREANVIAAGDAIAPERDPQLDWFGGGWLGGRVDALALLLDLSDDETRFVPAYGAVVGRSAVQAEHDMLLALFERMVDRVRRGESAEEILAAGVLEDLGRSFAEPLKLVHDAHKGLWAHHNTLSPDVV